MKVRQYVTRFLAECLIAGSTRAFHAKLGLNGRRKDVMVRSSYVSPLSITGYLIRSINRIHGNHKSIDKRFDTEKGGSLITSSTQLRSLVVFCSLSFTLF